MPRWPPNPACSRPTSGCDPAGERGSCPNPADAGARLSTGADGVEPEVQNETQPFPQPMNPLLWPVRSVANGLGLAWWARVQTRSPDAVYWFGPFVRRSTLEAALEPFLADLRSEAPASIEHQLLRTQRGEPLTEAVDLA